MASLFSVSDFNCLKSSGYTFAIPRGWRSYGALDPNVKQNLKNAKTAGMANVDVYLFPCRSKSAKDQVNSLYNELKGYEYGMIWIDIETNPSPNCGWSGHTFSSNCQYIVELIDAIKATGIVPGIYAS